MVFEKYYQEILSLLESIHTQENEKMDAAAALVANCWGKGGLVYLFGCGHSHIPVEEVFYRAGGMAPVAPILLEELMLHEGASRSSRLEKEEGHVKTRLNSYPICKKDVFICISTSGKNAAPIEAALEARERGAAVIAISSSAYKQEISGHGSGLLLWQAADLFLDNKAPYGDACLKLEGFPARLAPLSTFGSCYLLNSVFYQAAEKLWESGMTPEVFVSGNIPLGGNANQLLLQKYQKQIRHL